MTQTQAKTDPRIVRTRKFIMDAFIELSSQKEFKDMTVKDITEKAMINRATFYYHFQDIYDLLENALLEVFQLNLMREDYDKDTLDEAAIVKLFRAVTSFQQSLSNRCLRGYEDTIARIIMEQLEVIFFNMLKKQENKNEQALKLTAVMLSWGLYGASVKWRHSGGEPEAFIKPAVPFILSGVESKA